MSVSVSVSISVSVSVLSVAADVAAMQFYRRSSNVTSEMDEMSSEGRKTTPLSAERDVTAAAEADDEKAADVDAAARPTTVRQLFMDADLRQPLFIACALVTIQQFSGINAVSGSTISLGGPGTVS